MADKRAGRSTRKTVGVGKFGGEVVTIASNVGQGADQKCTRCLVWPVSGNTGKIKISNTTATVNDVELVDDVPIEIPVENTNMLYFYGATNGDKVHILWFD